MEGSERERPGRSEKVSCVTCVDSVCMADFSRVSINRQ